MTEPAVIQATYSDFRMIKGRKVLAITFEVPLENMQHVMEALGTPMPDKSTWVAIALMGSEPGKLKGGSLAQQAGIMCNEGAFQQWVQQKTSHRFPKTSEGSADFIREYCDVDSRAHLDHNDQPAKAFHDLKSDYEFWLKDAA